MAATKKSDGADREIEISKIINAPRELVFKVWTDPKHLTHWFGPNGFSITTKKFSFEPGGHWNFIMHGPDGTDYDNRVYYQEIVEPEYITYSQDAGIDNDPNAFQTRITFEKLDNKTTKLTLLSTFASAERRNFAIEKIGAIEGGNQTLGRLDTYMQTIKQSNGTAPFIIERKFKAPIALMFKVWTDPNHMSKWFGPKGSRVDSVKSDLRVGGMYHYKLISADGSSYWGRAVYREITPVTRLVWVNSFSDKDGGLGRHPLAPTWPAEMLTTMTLTQHGEFTKVRIEWLPINCTQAELDIFEQGRASMSGGWTGTFEQLEEYLKSMV